MDHAKQMSDVDFEKQLATFEEAMNKDLDRQNQEHAQKWQFDFTTAKPLTLQTKTMSWEPTSADSVLESKDSATRPVRRLQLAKPRMTIDPKKDNCPSFNLFSAGNSPLPGSNQVFAGTANYQPRLSIFGSSCQTDSTAVDSSAFNNSVLAGSLGKASVLDFDFSIGRTTSIVSKLKKNQSTEIREEARESSIESLNDRDSSLTNEGRVNSPDALVTGATGAATRSRVKVPEFNPPVVVDDRSFESGGGSGRKGAAIKSIIIQEDELNEFSPFESAPEESKDDDAECCDVEACDLDESSPLHVESIPEDQIKSKGVYVKEPFANK